MTPQDWEDISILQDSIKQIIRSLKDISKGDIHDFCDCTESLKECGSKLMRVSSLTDKLYNDKSDMSDCNDSVDDTSETDSTTDVKIQWKRGVFDTPNNTSYDYSIEHRYCRCLTHAPGTSFVREMAYDTVERKWGYITFGDGCINFIACNKINPPYYWCYLKDVEKRILKNSYFTDFRR